MRGEHNLAALPHGDRCAGTHLGGKRHCSFFCLARLAQTVDEAEVEGALRWDGLTGEDDFHRDVATDDAWQAEETAGTSDEISLGFGETERRAGACDHHVGSENNLASACGRETVDGDDDGLLALAIDEASESAALGVEVGSLARVDRLQVSSGTEDRALLTGRVGLQHADPDVLVSFHLVDGCFDAGCDVAVHGVACVGTIEGDNSDFAVDFVGDDVRI